MLIKLLTFLRSTTFSDLYGKPMKCAETQFVKYLLAKSVLVSWVVVVLLTKLNISDQFLFAFILI